MPFNIIIPTEEIVQASFLIENIPTIPEGLDRTQRAGQSASLADGLAPSIVSIFYHLGAVAVNQANDVALQVVQVSISSTVEKHHRRLVLRIAGNFARGIDVCTKIHPLCIEGVRNG